MNRPTVLLVEDEPAVLVLARLVLERAGYDVIAAETGPDAVARYREAADRIGVVLLDVNLPGLSGWGVLAELRKDRPDLRVVVATGDDCEDMPVDEPQLVPTAVLTKPYRPADLARLVERVLAGW